MKYVVQMELDPFTGVEVEANPQNLQAMLGKWQALEPLGMYFSLDRRAITAIVDVPNEDALFEALHAAWVVNKSYPRISPVVSVEEFPQLLQRAGVM